MSITTPLFINIHLGLTDKCTASCSVCHWVVYGAVTTGRGAHWQQLGFQCYVSISTRKTPDNTYAIRPRVLDFCEELGGDSLQQFRPTENNMLTYALKLAKVSKIELYISETYRRCAVRHFHHLCVSRSRELWENAGPCRRLNKCQDSHRVTWSRNPTTKESIFLPSPRYFPVRVEFCRNCRKRINSKISPYTCLLITLSTYSNIQCSCYRSHVSL